MTVRNAYHWSNFRHFAILALLLSGTFFAPTHVHSETKDITVDVDPGLTYEGNVGAGFNLIQNTATRLNIHLTSSRGTIVKSELISSSGAAWTKYNETYWVCEGIGPNDHFWCIIKCTMAYPGGPGGPGQPPIRWMSVSDVDFDADTGNASPYDHRSPSRSQDEDYKEYPGVLATEPIGLVIPVNDSNHVSWSQRDWGLPMSYSTDTMDVLDAFLEIRPKKGGSWDETCPGAVRYTQDGSQTSQASKHLSINQDITLSLRLESLSSTTTGYRATGIATFTPDSPSAGYQPCDKLNYMFLGCDIDVDSDNDGYISSTNGDGTGEDFFEDHPSNSSFYSSHPEYKYGMIVGVNDGDDDADGNPDNGYISDGNWSNSDSNTIENTERLGRGVFRGLVISDMYKLMMDPSMSPVIRITMISGDGAVRLFLADPVTPIGVFSSVGQSVDEFGGTTNWNRLYQLSKDIYIEGLRTGEVILGYQILLNGILIHQDSVRITVVETDNTEWLVTHDPKFEKDHAQRVPTKYKQAELMNNKAWATITCSSAIAPTIQAELWDLGGTNTKICNGHYVGYCGGKAVFEFRTTVGSTTTGAKTDTDGSIYVEDMLLPEGLEGWKLGEHTDYYIRFYQGATKLAEHDIRIGPLFSGLSVSPNVLAETPATFDPYEDTFDIITGWGGVWYGMQIDYHLNGNVVGEFAHPVNSSSTTMFSFMTDSSVPLAERGDMTGTHYLYMPSSLLIAAAADYTIKWEGFNELLYAYTEQADAIFMSADQDNHEAELARPWGPTSAPQSHKGATPLHLVGEGKYKMRIGCKREFDQSQVQRLQVGFEVQYR